MNGRQKMHKRKHPPLKIGGVSTMTFIVRSVFMFRGFEESAEEIPACFRTFHPGIAWLKPNGADFFRHGSLG